MNNNKLTVIVTGATSGFGALTAQALARSGYYVYAGILPTEQASPSTYDQARLFAQDNEVDLEPVQLDITSDGSVILAVTGIIQARGSIEVLVHNAGKFP